MIAYDLECHRGHQFEAWFKNHKTFESQRKRSHIECPQCGSSKVEMIYRPQAIRKNPLKSGAASGQRAAARLEVFLRENFEYVGKSFAEEARKAHYGETEPRNIRGETTAEEEAGLQEEGISFFKVSLPKSSN